MFPDALLPNLLIFALGQFAAIGYLRTGLVMRGTWLLIVSWVLADLALVMRFAYQSTGTAYSMVLLLMQLVSLGGFLLFVYGRIRRASKATVAVRDERFRAAFTAYLRNETDEALELYQALQRRDPWDVSVRVGLATVLELKGDAGRAKRHWRSAQSLDTEGQFRDLFAARKLQSDGGATSSGVSREAEKLGTPGIGTRDTGTPGTGTTDPGMTDPGVTGEQDGGGAAASEVAADSPRQTGSGAGASGV